MPTYDKNGNETYSRRETAILYMPEIVHFESKIANLEAKFDESAKVVVNLQKDKSDLLKNFEKAQENTKLLEKENVDLKEKINFGRKMLTDSENRIKSCEMKNCQLLKQISDFEQVLILEREKFEKERRDFQTERKDFETKSVEFSLKISDLEKILAKEIKEFECKKNVFQKEKNGFEKKKTGMLNEFSVKINELEKELEDGRKEIEKKKVDGFKEKCLKDEFEKEKKVFHFEIRKLIKKISDLSTKIMIERKSKSDLQSRFDLYVKKFKEFETKVVDKSNHSSKDQIRSSNLFYDPLIDKSDNCYFKKVKMIWRVKGSAPIPKSSKFVQQVKINN